MKFVILTDLHLLPLGKLFYGLDPFERLDDCIVHIRENHSDAEFLVVTGDLTDKGDTDAYAALRQRLNDFPIPAHLMLGNHDNREAFRGVFPDRPSDENGFVQFSFEIDNKVFVFLDTLGAGERERGELCEKRLAWLEERLTEVVDREVFLFLHHAPTALGVPAFQKGSFLDPLPFLNMLSRFANIRHLFFGHMHLPVSGTLRGIPFSVTPSVCHHLVLDFASDKRLGFTATQPSYDIVKIEDEATLINRWIFADRFPDLAIDQAQ